MSFKRWLKKYLKAETALGDLARDVTQDPAFPYRTNHDGVRRYLKANGACEKALEAFERGWGMYQFEREHGLGG